jgi:hypothetical protein
LTETGAKNVENLRRLLRETVLDRLICIAPARITLDFTDANYCTVSGNHSEACSQHLSRNDKDDIDKERAILGGLVGYERSDVPSWVCLGCEPRWSEVHRLALQDYEWNREREEAVASQEFEDAARIRRVQGGLMPRLAALVQQLIGG